MTRRLIKLFSNSPSPPSSSLALDDEAKEHLLSTRDIDEEEKVQDDHDWTLHIRCATTEQKEVQIHISSEATIKQLLDVIVARLQINEETQTARLIYQGKLLSDSLGHVISSEVKNHSFIHVAISPKPMNNRARRPAQRTSSSSGNNRNPNPVSGEAEGQGVFRGLDLLRMRDNPFGNTLSEEEVQIIRSLFGDSIREFLREQRHRLTRNVAQGESEEDFQYRVEREWMEAQSPYSEFRMNIASSSSYNNTSSSSPRHSAALLSQLLFGRVPPFFVRSANISNASRETGTGADNNNNTNTASEGSGEEEQGRELRGGEQNNDQDNDSGREGQARSSRWNSVLASLATSSSDGTDSSDTGSLMDFLYGVAVGYTIGFLVVFCIWDRNVVYRQKVGLLVGILLQLSLNMLWVTSHTSSSGAEGENPSGSMDFYNQNSDSNNNDAPKQTQAASLQHILNTVTAASSVSSSTSSSNSSLRGSVASESNDQSNPLLTGSPFGFSI